MKIKYPVILRNQSGMAMIIALIMMIVLVLVSLSTIFASIFEMKLSGNKRGFTSAFYAADSGVQMALSNIDNFNLPAHFVDNKYAFQPDPNPTDSKVVIYNVPDQKGAPRGRGISAIHVNFEYFLIESTGEDQLDIDSIKPMCIVEQKVVRLLPTLQGGN